MSASELAAASVTVTMIGLCCLIAICLHGTSPRERPGILRALAEVLASVWPWGGFGQDRGVGQGRPRNLASGRAQIARARRQRPSHDRAGRERDASN